MRRAEPQNTWPMWELELERQGWCEDGIWRSGVQSLEIGRPGRRSEGVVEREAYGVGMGLSGRRSSHAPGLKYLTFWTRELENQQNHGNIRKRRRNEENRKKVRNLIDSH